MYIHIHIYRCTHMDIHGYTIIMECTYIYIYIYLQIGLKGGDDNVAKVGRIYRTLPFQDK